MTEKYGDCYRSAKTRELNGLIDDLHAAGRLTVAAGWREWISTRPAGIRAVVERFRIPFAIYQAEPWMVVAFTEDDDGGCTTVKLVNPVEYQKDSEAAPVTVVPVAECAPLVELTDEQFDYWLESNK